MIKHNLRMVSKILDLLVLAGLTLFVGCKTQEVETHWSATPVQVDGEMMEWANMPTTYFEDSGVQLGLCNDSENLYILFRFSNQSWARAIRMGGVTLWLDNSGKKNKDFGIRYTGGPPLSEMLKPGMTGEGGFQDNLTPEQKERLKKQQEAMADQFKVLYKKGGQEITIPANGSSGPAVSFASPQGIYTYEFKIPLRKSDAFDYGIGAQPGQTISLGLEWGDIEMGDRQRMRPEGSGMGMPPGGGLPGGGGRGGGAPGGQGSPGMQKPEKQELWVKTQLASPPAR